MPDPWFANGLTFTCTACGNCCTGEPGLTWVDEAEVAALASRAGLDVPAFRRRYTVTVHREGQALTSLKEKPGGDCVFYQRGTGCTVYTDRPRQCRTWPFWRRVLRTPDTWATEARGCPGMNRGKLHDLTTIAGIAADDGLPG